MLVYQRVSPSASCPSTGCSFMLAFDAEASLFPMAVSVRYSVATMLNAQHKTEIGRIWQMWCDHGNHPFESESFQWFLQWFLNFPGDLRWDSKETHQRCHEERCSCQVPDLYWDGVWHRGLAHWWLFVRCCCQLLWTTIITIFDWFNGSNQHQ